MKHCLKPLLGLAALAGALANPASAAVITLDAVERGFITQNGATNPANPNVTPGQVDYLLGNCTFASCPSNGGGEFREDVGFHIADVRNSRGVFVRGEGREMRVAAAVEADDGEVEAVVRAEDARVACGCGSERGASRDAGCGARCCACREGAENFAACDQAWSPCVAGRWGVGVGVSVSVSNLRRRRSSRCARPSWRRPF